MTDSAAASDEPAPDILDALQLTLVPGIGSRMYQLLVDRFGSPGAVLEASIAQLREVSGIGPKLAMTIVAEGTPAAARAEWERCRAAGARLLLRGGDDYPPPLDRIPDPPGVLYCRGDWRPADELAIGIVGSRHCTPYGRQQAERLAGGLARAGITVVSGLARGIDGAAHQGALDAGGRTLAVCATGLGTIYPPEHAELAIDITHSGALLSESPMLQAPIAGLFPQRNRIISGLSLGVIVVEAPRSSGALHTARHAMEQNREVFAVPGRIDHEACLGCLDLIRDGATLIRGVDDVLAALGPLTRPVAVSAEETVHHPQELVLNDLERSVLNLISSEAQPVDAVLRASPLEASRVLSTLTVLEMRRLVQRLPGGQIVRR